MHNTLIKSCYKITLSYLSVLSVLALLYNNNIFANSRQLHIAPTTSLVTAHDTLKFIGYYYKSFSGIKKKSYSMGASVNPFWDIKQNSIMYLLSQIYVGVNVDHNQELFDKYAIRRNNLQAGLQYNFLESKLLSLYAGVSLGEATYDMLIIDSISKNTFNKVERLSSYSFFIGGDFAIFSLFSPSIITKFISQINYLDNIHTSFEYRQYKIKTNDIKYIDDYNYKIYNIGIKYKMPIYYKYSLK